MLFLRVLAVYSLQELPSKIPANCEHNLRDEPLPGVQIPPKILQHASPCIGSISNGDEKTKATLVPLRRLWRTCQGWGPRKDNKKTKRKKKKICEKGEQTSSASKGPNGKCFRPVDQPLGHTVSWAFGGQTRPRTTCEQIDNS